MSNVTAVIDPTHKGSKIAWIKHEPLTVLLPYGSMIVTCGVIFIALLSTILERWLLRKIYGDVYRALEKPGNERRRRSFTYYHVGAMMLFFLFCTGAYPVLSFLAGPATFQSVVGSRRAGITTGDMMFLFAEIYTAYYLYEMCFRTQFASPLTVAHHVGLLLIVQTAIALFGNPRGHKEATIEFFMCMVWGAFDVTVELPIFTMMILWRVKRGNSLLLSRIAYGCCAWILTGASLEIAITVYLLNRSWDYWGKVFRVVTPCIFSLWIVTQLYGCWRLYTMGRAEALKHKENLLQGTESA